MNEITIIHLASEAIKTVLLIAGPFLLTAISIGVLVSLLQAMTQINEATLTFIPKMIGMIFILILMASWMLETLKNYTVSILGNLQEWSQ